MSKVMLAFGSFIVGACCMYVYLPGSHMSTIVQLGFAQATKDTGKGTGMVFRDAEPVVRGLGPRELHGLLFTSKVHLQPPEPPNPNRPTIKIAANKQDTPLKLDSAVQ